MSSVLISARNRLLLVAALISAVAVTGEVASGSHSGVQGDALASNHQLLSNLGLARLQGSLPKKVPATEDDSRVFVVRLPPSQHYYSLLKAPPSLANSVSKVGVGFRSNGKPARVYHWNIPVLKKMAVARRRSAAGGNKSPIIKPSKHPSKGKRKSSFSFHRLKQGPGLAESGPSPYYYVPAKKSSMHKLLGGNGKPHAMYVLEKSKAPAYYQRLLP